MICPRVVIAPDSFRGCMDATFVANAIEQGLIKGFPKLNLVKIPIADGGEGTVKTLVSHHNGEYVDTKVKGMLGGSIVARWGKIDQGKTAVIEISATSGIELVTESERNPMLASSYGFGELMLHAIDQGCNKLLLGLGGSGTIDAGMGLLQALGIRFFDCNGVELSLGGKELVNISSIQTEGLTPKLNDIEICVLCDINNPLFGKHSIVKMFGPQKGASSEMIHTLERGLRIFADQFMRTKNIKIGREAFDGASGGIAASLKHVLGAKCLSGIEFVASSINLNEQLSVADLLITGEGKVDAQTLRGKAPYGVAAIASTLGVTVVGIAGKIDTNVTLEQLKYFSDIYTLNTSESDCARFNFVYNCIINTAFQIGQDFNSKLQRRTLCSN